MVRVKRRLCHDLGEASFSRVSAPPQLTSNKFEISFRPCEVLDAALLTLDLFGRNLEPSLANPKVERIQLLEEETSKRARGIF